MMNKFEVDIRFGKLVAELYHTEGSAIPAEVSIVLETKDGMQDICLVRKSDTKKSIDCLVWSDGYDEDYTNKFTIEVYEEQ